MLMIGTDPHTGFVHHKLEDALVCHRNDLSSQMMMARKLGVWAVVLSVVTIGIGITVSLVQKHRHLILRGAVTRQDTDPSKQVPIANADIIATTGGLTTQTKSDQAGLFTLSLPKGFRRQQSVTLRLEHPDYHPLQLDEIIGDQLYVAHMIPIVSPGNGSAAGPPEQVISNIRVRYVFRTTDVADLGSEVKTFQVANTGNIPCERQPLCSPDRKWKAAVGSVSLDAGERNEFRNVRVSCIAGPCPFTRIEHQTVSANGRHLTVAARNWSDTVTFLIEAEVVHPAENDIVRESYPAIFGASLRFTLPASAEGPSIEAELNGETIVFPLGPNLSLSWAQCTEAEINDRVTAYHCELRPGYRFQ